jgi:hypothetical protein
MALGKRREYSQQWGGIVRKPLSTAFQEREERSLLAVLSRTTPELLA